MTSLVYLELDTTGPQGLAAEINGGASFATTQDVLLAVTSTSPDAAQIKVWGDVDPAANPDIQTTEAASSWIELTAEIAVKLATADGAKTLTSRLRDDVWNESATVDASITLNTTAPVVFSTGLDVDKISEVDGKNVASFAFTADQDYQAWEVRVVPADDSMQTAGTLIPTTAGSTNTSGGAGTGTTPKTVTINGTDLKTASAGDATKKVKVFVQNAAGTWSVNS